MLLATRTVQCGLGLSAVISRPAWRLQSIPLTSQHHLHKPDSPRNEMSSAPEDMSMGLRWRQQLLCGLQSVVVCEERPHKPPGEQKALRDLLASRPTQCLPSCPEALSAQKLHFPCKYLSKPRNQVSTTAGAWPKRANSLISFLNQANHRKIMTGSPRAAGKELRLCEHHSVVESEAASPYSLALVLNRASLLGPGNLLRCCWCC